MCGISTVNNVKEKVGRQPVIDSLIPSIECWSSNIGDDKGLEKMACYQGDALLNGSWSCRESGEEKGASP